MQASGREDIPPGHFERSGGERPRPDAVIGVDAVEALAGGEQEIGQGGGDEHARPHRGWDAPARRQGGGRQGQQGEHRHIDGQALQNKMAGDKQLEQKGVKHAVGQDGGGLLPGGLAEQRDGEKEAGQRHQKVEKAVALPVFFREIVLIFWHDGKGDADQRVHQEIGGPGGAGCQAVVELGWRQGEQNAEREHDQGRAVEAGGQKHNPAGGKEPAGFQKGVSPQNDGGGQSLAQKIHAQGKVLQGDKQENAQPGSGRIAADPGKHQDGEQEVEHEQKGTVVVPQQGDRQVQKEIARLRPARAVQPGGGDGVKGRLVKAVVKAGDVSKGGQQPAGQAHHEQIPPFAFGPLKRRRCAAKARANQQIIWQHGPSPHTENFAPVSFPSLCHTGGGSARVNCRG